MKFKQIIKEAWCSAMAESAADFKNAGITQQELVVAGIFLACAAGVLLLVSGGKSTTDLIGVGLLVLGAVFTTVMTLEGKHND